MTEELTFHLEDFDGPLSVMNSVVWDLLDAGTQYIDSIAYSAYYASLGAVI